MPVYGGPLYLLFVHYNPFCARRQGFFLGNEPKSQIFHTCSYSACSVSSFSSGRALLEAVGGFDVIFLDIQMKQPDGMETARLLRQRVDHSMLVFVTVLKELLQAEIWFP